MKPKFSIAHLTLLELTPPELVYLADRVGFDFVSLRTISMSLNNEPNHTLSSNPLLLKETKQALHNTDVQLLDIELMKISKECDVREYERSLEIAAELGGKHVISSVWTDDNPFVIEQFSLLCEIANQYGLTVELEAVPISSLTNLQAVIDVLEQVKQPNQGLLVDIHHFHRANDRIETLRALPKEWFHFIHLCDAQQEIPSSKEEMRRILREERLYVGEGGIDIHSIVNAIPPVPMSIELPNIKRVKQLGAEQFAKNCLESAKQYFANKYFGSI